VAQPPTPQISGNRLSLASGPQPALGLVGSEVFGAATRIVDASNCNGGNCNCSDASRQVRPSVSSTFRSSGGS
jgi:hypothetical protein